MSIRRPAPKLQPLTQARVAALGERGTSWLAALPSVIDELEHDWSITVEHELPGGSGSYVARVRTAHAAAAVLKVTVTSEGLAEQLGALRRANGRGYARLLQEDLGRQAMLLEALGPSLEVSGLAPERQLVILADTLALAWEDPAGRRRAPGRGGVVPPGVSTSPGEDKASGLYALISDLWPQLGRPCSPAVVEQALAFADGLRQVPDRELVVVHGDPHPGNLLRLLEDRPGGETGYCFVDPDGFVADRAYDLGVAIRDWTAQLDGPNPKGTLRRYCQLLAEHTGVAVDRIWQWGFVERVSTGLYLLSFGAERLV
jgi:streptomycin 6-kinase